MWNMRRFAERAPRSIRGCDTLRARRVIACGISSRIVCGLGRIGALGVSFLVQARHDFLNDLQLKLTDEVRDTIRRNIAMDERQSIFRLCIKWVKRWRCEVIRGNI
jgi:hypothetical protein